MSFAIALDLDDTLYPERTFVQSGFSAVATMVAERTGGDRDSVLRQLEAELARSGRGAVFDAVLERNGWSRSISVEACVRAYREHEPSIALADGVAEALDSLGAHPLYLVTDGDPHVQQRKIDALGISDRFRAVYRTWAYGRAFGKPSLSCFAMAREDARVPWDRFAYIADDPAKDFVALNSVGALTIRVLTGRCAGIAALPGHDGRWSASTFPEAARLALGLAAGSADAPA